MSPFAWTAVIATGLVAANAVALASWIALRSLNRLRAEATKRQQAEESARAAADLADSGLVDEITTYLRSQP